MNKIIKILLVALILLFAPSPKAFAQKTEAPKYRKISEMIADYQKLNGLYRDTFKLKVPEPEEYETHETTIIGVITFPNSVKVKNLVRKRRISDLRKEAVNKWWKDFGGVAEMRYFFVNEIQVKEDNKTYWVMADENHVITPLEKPAAKNKTVILKMRILGYHRTGKKFDFFLMAERVEEKPLPEVK
jgi:hypothetical protein